MIRAFRHIGFGITAMAVLTASDPLYAQFHGQDCSSLIANDSFSQQFEGFLNITVNSGGALPLGVVPSTGAGFITFLPHGKVTGRLTLAIGGLGVIPVQFENTSLYSLSWDTSKDPAICSGTATLKGSGETFNFNLIVSRDGQRVEMMHSDPGLIVGVTAVPMDISWCTNNTLDGTYSYNLKGWGLAPPPTDPGSIPANQLLGGYFPLAFSGALEFHPRATAAAPAGSSVTWWDTGSLNGTIVQRTGTGSYKINPDCTGSLVLTEKSGQTFHQSLFADRKGKTLYTVNTDSISVVGAPMPVPTFVLSVRADCADAQCH